MINKSRTIITSAVAGVMLFATDVAAYAHGGEIEPGAPAPVAETTGNTATLVVVGAVVVVAAVVAIGVIAYARSRNSNDQPAE